MNKQIEDSLKKIEAQVKELRTLLETLENCPSSLTPPVSKSPIQQ